MSAEPTLEPTTTSSGNLAKMQSFGKWLSDRAELDRDEIDGQEIAANIATNILAANTLDDIFAADESSLPAGKDLVDLEQRVLNFDIRKGTNPDMMNELVGGVFLVIHSIKLSNGEYFDWNTSATGIVAKLVAAERKGYLDGTVEKAIDCKVVQKGTSNAISLALLPKRVA